MSDPFRISGPTCISFSGGRTSAYMLWRVLQSNDGLPEDAMVVFANTGKEEEATLRFIQNCSENWGVHITWVEYQPEAPGYKVVTFETASRNGEPFEALIKKKSYLPNPVQRFCSHEMKNKPIAAFTGLGDEDTMIGIRADEPIRIAKMRKRGLSLPLVSAGVYKSHIREFWNAHSFDLGLPERSGLTNLGNCDLCFLKDFGVVMSNVKEKPTRAVWWAKQEKSIGATFHKSRPSYQSMMDFVDTQFDFVGHEDAGPVCFCGD